MAHHPHRRLPLSSSAALLIATVAAADSHFSAPTWRHGWDNVGSMLYMHGGNKTGLITPEAAAFTAAHYPIVAFSSCYGGFRYGGPSHEEAATETARSMRRTNPNVKNTFYYKSDIDAEFQICSDAGPVFEKHPEWRFGDNYVNASSPSFRRFWADHLLRLARETDEADATKPLFDAFYIDGLGGPPPFPTVDGLDHDQSLAYFEGMREMTLDLQNALDDLGYGQIAIANGLDDPAGLPDHSSFAPSSMIDHFAIIQFLNRDNGKWLLEPMRKLLFDVARSPINDNRTIIIKGWPGPIIDQRDIWPNNTQPKTDEGMRRAAAKMLNSALALFLLVAEDNVWFSYSWFWDASDYIPFGKNHTCPDNFYPVFECPLGEPLGPPKETEGAQYEYTRAYQHATVYVDLKDRNATYVAWHSGDSEHCPGSVHAENPTEMEDGRNDGTILSKNFRNGLKLGASISME